MNEAGKSFVRLQPESVEHVAIESKPAGEPVGAVAERCRRGDDVHRAGACGQFLLPGRRLGVRPGKTHHCNDQRRIHKTSPLDLDVGDWRRRIFLREHLRNDIPGAGPGIAFEHDEAPRCQLAMVWHPRADSQDGLEFGRRGAGAAHLARFHRAADFQEFEGVRHFDVFRQGCEGPCKDRSAAAPAEAVF